MYYDSKAFQEYVESKNGTYADSVEQEVARKSHERDVFRIACGLHDDLSRLGGFAKNTIGDANDIGIGYLVNDGKSEVRVRTCTVETIYRFLLEHWHRVAGSPSTYFVARQDTDYVYLDVSYWFWWPSDALVLACKTGEKAIYSLADKRTINL